MEPAVSYPAGDVLVTQLEPLLPRRRDGRTAGVAVVALPGAIDDVTRSAHPSAPAIAANLVAVESLPEDQRADGHEPAPADIPGDLAHRIGDLLCSAQSLLHQGRSMGVRLVATRAALASFNRAGVKLPSPVVANLCLVDVLPTSA